jgi:protein-L-isoaspartate(D-aspartate) O-methyltransferase
MDWNRLRETMIEEQLVPRGIHDKRVLDAMRRLPRHLFVPETLRARAYEDRALPIGWQQTISQPYMVAWMVSALALRGDERVLEVGTGSGYAAALLGRLAREVHTVEIIPALAREAEKRLASLGLENVHVHDSDGSLGWPAAAPYDAIIAAAASPGIPPILVEQLRIGGRLVLPLRENGQDVLVIGERRREGLVHRTLGACAFVPLTGSYSGLEAPKEAGNDAP